MKISILEIVLYSIIALSAILYAVFAIKDTIKKKKQKQLKDQGIETKEQD